MQGKILNYDPLAAKGVILGDNGSRYEFKGEAWKSSETLKNGLVVDFLTEENQAKDIYPVQSKQVSLNAPKKLTSALLGIFFGGIGAHKFFLGYKKQGVITLVIWFFGLIFLGIPTIIISIIGMIEGVIYLSKSDEEFEKIYIENKKPWF